MVVVFETIVLHLQKQIAKKMSVCDTPNFSLSSKHGRNLLNMVSNGIPIEILDVQLDDKNSIYIVARNPFTRGSHYWNLENLRIRLYMFYARNAKTQAEMDNFGKLEELLCRLSEIPMKNRETRDERIRTLKEFLILLQIGNKMPIFVAPYGIHFKENLEALLEFLPFAETGLFRFHNTHIVWEYMDVMDQGLFVKTLAAFDVKGFFFQGRRIIIDGTEQLKGVKTFGQSDPINVYEEVFLHPKVEIIHIEGLDREFPISSTLNLVFQQWLRNQRDIKVFSIKSCCGNLNLAAETVFANVTCSFTLTKTLRDTGNGAQTGEVRLLQTGSKKLLVLLEPDRFTVRPAKESTEELVLRPYEYYQQRLL